jgi:hypothetical protein
VGSVSVDPEGMLSTILAFTAKVHATTRTLATFSSGGANMLDWWRGLGLDFFQCHWYAKTGRTDDYNPLRRNYDHYRTMWDGIDKPLVIAEFQAGESDNALAVYEGLYQRGYAGAWPWSAAPYALDPHRIDWHAAQTFGLSKSDLGPRPT